MLYRSNNKQNIANLPVTRVCHPNPTIYNICMSPLHAHPPIMFLPLAAPSQKHRKNARATPIFFSDQYTICSPVTKNPPSHNRKPRFASALITIHCPPFSAPALCSFRPRGRQSVAAAVQRSYVLLSLCSSVSRVSGFRPPLRRQPLCLLRPPGRQSVAVRRAAALCVSYVILCSLCFPR